MNKYKIAIVDCLFGLPDLSLPLNLEKICKYHNIRLYTYTEYSRKKGCTIDELINISQSNTAFTLRKHSKGRLLFEIVYNDTDLKKIDTNMYRFSIGHELGHIFLGHLNDLNASIQHSYLTDDVYKEYENEADTFSAYLLSPHIVFYNLKIRECWHIARLNRLSEHASTLRFKEYAMWLKNNIGNYYEEYDHFIFKKYKNYIYSKTCTNCHNKNTGADLYYCSICANTLNDSLTTKLFENGGIDMIYPEVSLIRCPKCSNENILEGDFCHICGDVITNCCSNSTESPSKCDNKYLPDNARYCNICGAESIFYLSNVLTHWKDDSTAYEIPF